jgi:hypothetical protein
VIVPVFVDDMTFASKSKEQISHFKRQLAKHFKLRYRGPTLFLLGVRFTRDRAKRTLHMDQRQYLVDMLERFGMADCSPVSPPMDPSERLDSSMSPSLPEDVAYLRDKAYVSAVSSMMYAAIATRPDIAYTINVLCRFMANPGPAHWKAVKYLLRNLRGTLDNRLTYASDPRAPDLFHMFSDADHVKRTHPGSGRDRE